MQKAQFPINPMTWKIEKIGVIGPGIVGMPMAGMLANAKIQSTANEPAKVIVIQRDSVNSGWKVEAINKGKSVIGGIEPELDDIVEKSVKEGRLSASSDFDTLSDADVVLVSVQTDKKGFEPDYGPMFGALDKLATALQKKPEGKVPLIIIESTLAPTTMDTLIREHFKNYGLVEGKDILLGNSPNRVMPGRLVERIRESDKLAGGLHSHTPGLISWLYRHIVKKGELYETNSLTAEIVKTLENAYRDVRIAFSTEIVRYCDEKNINFYSVRDEVNKRLSQADDASSDPNVVPSGGILIPMLGVGGHCLPKDGILLWWRNIESGTDTSGSLILKSRQINDESPVFTFNQATAHFGSLKDKKIALLGVAYRFNSEDTRNSPTLALANFLRGEGIDYVMHDPYVKLDDQNLLAYDQQGHFNPDLNKVLSDAEVVFLCTAHKVYMEEKKSIAHAPKLEGIMDACNIFKSKDFPGVKYSGIGRGIGKSEPAFIDFVYESFRAMEALLALEVVGLINFYNEKYTFNAYNKVKFRDVQRLARTCSTGCEIAEPVRPEKIPHYDGIVLRLIS